MMKNIKINYLKYTFLLGLVLLSTVNCERNPSEEATYASSATTAEIFTDSPIGMGSNFYFPYAPGPDNPIGSKLDAWTVDSQVSYKGTSSMRFDVPDGDNTKGNYAGGIFRVDGPGRDLSGYDALTFWAKASQNVTVSEIGFGEDFYPNKYVTTMGNVKITTNWVKYVIPIPDPSKLVQEKGMLRYAAGGTGTEKKGYTFWIDELRFEKLGTIGQPRPKILNGLNVTDQTFIGSKRTLTNLSQTFNMADGSDQTVTAAPSYFTFTSSDSNVATVSELGVVEVIGTGTVVITAKLGGKDATGSLTLNSLGTLPPAPTPTNLQANVKSIFSDAYVAETPINYDPKFGGSTTQTSLLSVNNDSFLVYTNNNYTGILFENKVNATDMKFMHVDIYAQQAGVQVEFQIRDVGANGVLNTNIFTGQPEVDDKDYRYTATNLTVNGWNSFNIPLAGNLTNQKNNLGAIILVGGPNMILDNVFFYEIPTAPTTAAPTPTVAAANVIAVFSDAYTNIAANLNPNWGQTTAVTQVPIAGNNTLRYGGFNYQGIEFGANQNLSAMTNLHLDYFSTNSTSLKVYLISPGPVEKSKTLTVPTTAGWNSINIPMSTFSPVVLSNVNQMKFDGNGTIYLDNIYFNN